jgi:hypothetical protein
MGDEAALTTMATHARPILLAEQHAFFEADPFGLKKAQQHHRAGLNAMRVAQADRQRLYSSEKNTIIVAKNGQIFLIEA